MNNIVNRIQELILNSNKDFNQMKISTIENSSGYDSIVISSEMTAYRPKVSKALFARIKTNGKNPYISFKNKYKQWFIENNIPTYSISSEKDFFRVSLSDFQLAIDFENKDFSQLAYKIYLDAMNFQSFGCCDKYIKCSDAKKCLHSDLLYSTACMYRKNLENNKIFYGKNKNISENNMTDLKIAVIDVETPNGYNDSICSIGITVIENNEIIEEKYFLVNPETSFDYRCTQIHGISEKDVADAFTFPELWERIKGYFSGYLLAGHNFTFDLSCINKSLKKYNIDTSSAYYIDTLTIAKDYVTNTEDYKLSTLCNTFKIELNNHHNSLDDSRATSNLLIDMMSKYEIDVDKYIKQYSFIEKKPSKRKKQYNDATRSLQELQGILFGVTCDGTLSNDEIYSIQEWANNHKELKGNFPYDKIYSAIEDVLEDNIITEDERDYLFSLFNNLLNPVETDNSVEDISLKGSVICLTGDFDCMSKDNLEIALSARGAIIKKNVVKNLNFLVVGNKGSQQWSQGNYGNKVKKAMQYNEKGCNIQIILETDFLNSIDF